MSPEAPSAAPAGDTQLQLLDEIARRFSEHPPVGDQAARYARIREKAASFALFLADTCPQCRELSVAFTKLDEVLFWANASIARCGKS